MEKMNCSINYVKELAHIEKKKNTEESLELADWMFTSIDLATEKAEVEKENRRLEKENIRLYGNLKFHNIL
jgi:hypothetical protein